MAHLKWIIESFYEATEEVKRSEAMLKRLIAVADTSEDVGLHESDSPCFHIAVEVLARQVRSAILNPGGHCPGVLGIEKKTGRAVVFDAALKEWWPKIQCEIAKVGMPNFKRLRVLLAQENARAVQQFPRARTSWEKYLQSLVRCLNGVESLLFRSTESGSQGGGKPRIWHDVDATSPSEYPAGPLTGTKQQLVRWIMQNTDYRRLGTPLKAGTYWGRKDGRRQCSIWFKNQQRFSEANKLRLAESTSTSGLTDVEKR